MIRRAVPLLPLFAQAAIATIAPGLAVAADDRAYCVAAKQLALAAETDVGVWTDKVTRNAGMAVSCERRIIEFRRFTYASSASMDDAWRQRKAADWAAAYCTNPIWGEALRGGWKIVLSVTAADGGHVAFDAICR